MKKHLLSMLTLVAVGTGTLCAATNKSAEINWNNIGNNIDIFTNFQSYTKTNNLPETTTEECPRSFPAITVRPQDFTADSGNWKLENMGSTDILTATYGHRLTTAKAILKVEEPGLYRVWVKYFHLKDYVSSFSLSIKNNEINYTCNFDWSANNPKESALLPDPKSLPTKFMWESGPMVELAPGDYTMELSTVVHAGPFTGRKVAMVVLTADPLLEGIDEVIGNNSYPASDLIRQAWNTWVQRPGALPWSSLTDEQQLYYLNWQNAFLKKLATKTENDAEKRLAAKSYQVDSVNVVGTPAEIIAEKERLSKELPQNTEYYGVSIEAEDLQALNGWTIDKDKQASAGKFLKAAYSDGLASAKTSITIPKAGKYYVWVNYMLLHKYYSLFDVTFTNDKGKKVAKLDFANPKDRQKLKNGVFTWERIPVELPAGKLELSLNKNIGKAPYTFRKVDRIFISNSSTFSASNK